MKPLDTRFVPPTVSFELWSPVLWLRSRQLTAVCAVMTMPKAAVHQNDLAIASKHDVRTAGQIRLMQPIPVPHGVDEPPDDHLRLGVGLADALHPLGHTEPFLLHPRVPYIVSPQRHDISIRCPGSHHCPAARAYSQRLKLMPGECERRRGAGSRPEIHPSFSSPCRNCA